MERPSKSVGWPGRRLCDAPVASPGASAPATRNARVGRFFKPAYRTVAAQAFRSLPTSTLGESPFTIHMAPCSRPNMDSRSADRILVGQAKRGRLIMSRSSPPSTAILAPSPSRERTWAMAGTGHVYPPTGKGLTEHRDRSPNPESQNRRESRQKRGGPVRGGRGRVIEQKNSIPALTSRPAGSTSPASEHSPCASAGCSCGFSTQWPSSGKFTNRDGTPCRCSAVNSSCPWPIGQRKSRSLWMTSIGVLYLPRFAGLLVRGELGVLARLLPRQARRAPTRRTRVRRSCPTCSRSSTPSSA